MVGVVRFLIEWLAVSHISSTIHPIYQRIPSRSPWTLHEDFQNFTEDQIEGYLPQICSIILDEESYAAESEIYDYFRGTLIDKCKGCLTFGMRVCGHLKVHFFHELSITSKLRYISSTQCLLKVNIVCMTSKCIR
jgi:hypothetical protein